LAAGWKSGFYFRAFGATLDELREHGDTLLIERLAARIRASREIGRAVVLALDGPLTPAGDLDKDRTQVYVPNDYLIQALAPYDELLLGASINPHRADALERLDTVARAGAVLVKWIPAIMDIDPADPALNGFYDRLVELDMPLLVHVGQERAFGEANDALGDPLKLRAPLERGVTVIAAHLATTGRYEGEPSHLRLLPLFEQYDNLYADISSLTQINKRGYLAETLARPAVVERLIYGSDWPLQFFPLVSPWYHVSHTGVKAARAVRRIDNRWDRDVALKRAIGVPESVFARTATVLKLPP
ncbi:MAG: amidohydrolase family protein, partial [Gammaproteobacteria bacterium]|nr:amidohydrolase family protein [Gammaproteobacteria bacterium]